MPEGEEVPSDPHFPVIDREAETAVSPKESSRGIAIEDVAFRAGLAVGGGESVARVGTQEGGYGRDGGVGIDEVVDVIGEGQNVGTRVGFQEGLAVYELLGEAWVENDIILKDARIRGLGGIKQFLPASFVGECATNLSRAG